MTPDYLEIEDDQLRRAAAALEAARIGVWEFEPRTTRAFWDDRVRELWGAAPDQVIDYDFVVSRVHPDDREMHDRETANALDPAGAGEMDMEYRLIPRGDLPETWIKAKARTLFENGEPVRLVGTVEDITTRKRAEIRNDILLRELQHRLKNTLALVGSVIHLSKKQHDTVEDFADMLMGRVHALAHAQELLRSNDWQDVWLSQVCEVVLDSVVGDAGRIEAQWDNDILIPEQYVLTSSMAVYELATNSVKYGALSDAAGTVVLSGQEDGTTKRFIWRERGGPVVADGAFAQTGFGSLLLGTIWPQELHGSASYRGEAGSAVYALVLDGAMP
ncbi:sensor histidine kinase [Gymnodinialimonas hymeniacidonis]|uniref:sensor histidine kinase n=1 Tax=Gymnodinialimonas hymeniacidonis TaxID=3126508 RepID=UPI0034C6C51D